MSANTHCCRNIYFSSFWYLGFYSFLGLYAGRPINRSRVQIPAAALSSATLGKLFYTDVPLSPNSMIGTSQTDNGWSF